MKYEEGDGSLASGRKEPSFPGPVVDGNGGGVE